MRCGGRLRDVEHESDYDERCMRRNGMSRDEDALYRLALRFRVGHA